MVWIGVVVAASASSVVEPAQLAGLADAVAARAGGPIVVGAADAKLVDGAIGGRRPSIVRLSTVPDAEALAAEVGGACALWVDVADGKLRVEEIGACGDWTVPWVESLVALAGPDRSARIAAELGLRAADPAEVTRLGPAMAVSTHLERTGRTDPSVVRMFLTAALSADAEVRTQAVASAEVGGDPPSATRVQVPAPVAAPTAAAATDQQRYELTRDYERRHLYRDTLQFATTTFWAGQYGAYASTQNVVSWAVYDGGGRALPPIEFAGLVGDDANAADLRRRISRRTAIGWPLAVVGYSAMAMSSLLVDCDLADCGMARAFTVLGVGGVAGTIGLVDVMSAARLRNQVPRTWAPDEADTWIERHNDALRQELGLTVDEVRAVEANDD